MRAYGAGLILAFALIRRRLALLALAALLIALSGQVASRALADAFQNPAGALARLRIAVSGPGAQSAVRLAGQMEDIRAYCTFVAAQDEQDARALVEHGEVSAAVLLPDGFLDSIYSGDNLAPTLLIDDSRPLEGYLARWAGECAIGLLMDAQTGVTAVREAYIAGRADGMQPEKSRKQTIEEINLVYIQAALSRSDAYRVQTVSATGAFAPGDHYALSALAYLALLGGTVCFPLFDERSRRSFLCRLEGAGQPLFALRLASLTVCALLLAMVTGVPLALLGGFSFAGVAAGAVFAAGLAGVCAALTGHASGTSLTIFLVATVSLFVAGGILPPALLPAPLRTLLPGSPVRLLALALSPACGYAPQPLATGVLAGLGLLLWALTLWVAHKRHRTGVRT